VDDGVGKKTISMFVTEAVAGGSKKAAANWVNGTLAELNPKRPQVTVGEVKIDKTA